MAPDNAEGIAASTATVALETDPGDCARRAAAGAGGPEGLLGQSATPPANGPPIRTAVTLVAKTPRMMGSQREDWYLYDVLLDGQPIVTGSRVPEYDLARALLGRGIAGIADVFDGTTGKHRTIVNIEAAARLTVREHRRHGLQVVKWEPMPATAHQRSAAPEPTAETAAAEERGAGMKQPALTDRGRKPGQVESLSARMVVAAGSKTTQKKQRQVDRLRQERANAKWLQRLLGKARR
jgi:hypothetical protein